MPSILYGSSGGAGTFSADTYANIEGLSPSPGDVAYATDYKQFIARSYSAGNWTWSWRGARVVKPPADGWSWVNQGTATVTTNGPVITMDVPASATLSSRIRVRSAPATPYTVRGWFNDVDGNTYSGGLIFRDSGTGTLYRCGWNTGNARGMYVTYDDSPTVLNATLEDLVRGRGGQYSGVVSGFEIEDDGVNLYFKVVMPSGVPYVLFQEGRTSRMAGGPDQIGWHYGSGGGLNARAELVSWEVI